MGWPPQVGDALPRGAEAWCEQRKLTQWVLSDEGHGADWERTMLVGVEDAQEVWEAIAALAAAMPITGVRDLNRFGVSCEIDGRLTIGERSATFRTIWHYAVPSAAPRLVSAFPRL